LLWNSPFARTASMKIKRNDLAVEIAPTLKSSDLSLVNL
jgi:hypothetical protein